MKPVLLFALLLPLSALADFDPKGELTCHSADGKKILINDEFAGAGRARVSDSTKSFRASVTIVGQSAEIGLSSGTRAWGDSRTLRLDLNRAELTSRKEGAEIVRFIYVPAELETAGAEKVAAKCLQPVK